ncbi:MAG: tetratricopeptide repeat protein [Xanthomonadaceae bacterium]|nr:tetratricopeptide repeat protein [Xanthomonadaceae bacterium]
MAVFLIIAVLMTVGILAWMLRPLWQSSRHLMIGTLLIASLATFALYRIIGTPDALRENTGTTTPETLSEAVEVLHAELQRHPERVDGWVILARSYLKLGRLQEANDAYIKAIALEPDIPDLLVEAAQTRAMTNAPDHLIDEQAVTWLRHALELQPMHQRAIWFTGIWQRQNHRPAEAAATWETLLPIVPASTAPSLLKEINQARQDAGLPPLPAEFTTASSNDAVEKAPVATLLTVTVELAPELQTRLASDDVLFVLVRQPDGSPMPIAAKRVPAVKFPITVELSDADSPMPTLKLSQLQQISLSAHVSKSGNAKRAPDDLESSIRTVTLEQGGPDQYTLKIDQIVP